jgi:hypothetical protein
VRGSFYGSGGSFAARRALTKLINCVTPNVDGLWYRERLARGSRSAAG